MHFLPSPFMQLRSQQIVLMKSEGLSSKKIDKQLSRSEQKIYHQAYRYLSNGITGFRNKLIQGYKPIMESSDESIVIESIKKGLLNVIRAKKRWQEARGNETCKSTFRPFYQPWHKIWMYKKDFKGK